MYEIFEKLLKMNNVTAYKVAKDTGISYSSLSEWKMGRSVPKQDKLQKIADYFNVSIDYLIGRNTDFEIGLKFTSDEEAKIYIDMLSYLEKLNINGLQEARRYIKYLSELPEYLKDNQ